MRIAARSGSYNRTGGRRSAHTRTGSRRWWRVGADNSIGPLTCGFGGEPPGWTSSIRGFPSTSEMRKLLAGSRPKDLVMLTATPVNNSLWDLYSLLFYFVKNDAAFADAGIRSLRDHFASAMAMNPDDLSPEHLFDVLDAVAVRRTRPFVKRFYPNDTIMVDGHPQTITFPTPRVRRVTYNLDDVLPGFFDRFAHALDGPVAGGSVADPSVLALARYSTSRYRLTGGIDAYEIQLAGLLRSGMLKRFESSSYAFACTCRKMAASHDAFLALLDQGKVATGAALADWMATDSDELEQVNAYVEEWEAELEHAQRVRRRRAENRCGCRSRSSPGVRRRS